MASLLTQTRSGATSTDLAWRVLALVNLYRLLVPALLVVVHLALTPSPVGQEDPALFGVTNIVYFFFALLAIWMVKNRWPDISMQTFLSVCIDIVSIALLTYTSGGMQSGLATLLVLPVGAASFVVRQELAFMFAAMATLALLGQQAFTALALRTDSGDFASAGIVGALLFIVVLGVGPLARGLRESEERVRQREVDVANLAELNQFIVQHLRESILVVDSNDSIRLI